MHTTSSESPRIIRLQITRPIQNLRFRNIIQWASTTTSTYIIAQKGFNEHARDVQKVSPTMPALVISLTAPRTRTLSTVPQVIARSFPLLTS